MKILNLIIIFIFVSFLTFQVHGAGSNFQQEIYPLGECNDGIDNDGDGGIDFATDPQCTSWTDPSETDPIDPPVSSPQEENNTATQSQQSQPNQGSSNFQPPINSIPELINRVFSWESLGNVLGIEDLEDRIEQPQTQAYVLGGIIIAMLVAAAIMFVLIIYLSRSIRRNERFSIN